MRQIKQRLFFLIYLKYVEARSHEIQKPIYFLNYNFITLSSFHVKLYIVVQKNTTFFK